MAVVLYREVTPMPMDNEKVEDLVPTPELDRHAARNLPAAANSDNTLEGYAAINGYNERDEIAKLAKMYARQQGKETGPDDDDWFRAEFEVRRRLRGVDELPSELPDQPDQGNEGYRDHQQHDGGCQNHKQRV